MAASGRHKGWRFSPNNGILAAIYTGAEGDASALGANTAVDGVLLGAPVQPALAVDSIVISNLVASGDFLLALNRGGNSENYIFGDGSAGTLGLYAPNGAITLTPTSDVVVANATGLIVGATTQVTTSDGDGATDMVPEFQVLGTAAADGSLLVAAFNTTNTRAVSPHIALVKGAAATQVATTAVADNEVVGSIIAYGSDGTDFETPVAAIEFVVDDVGAPGTGAIGGSLEFSTTADGGETLTKAFTIDNVQNIMGADAAGPAIATNEAATTTNPTLIPDKAEMDTGIGWASDTLHIVLGGTTKANFSTTALTLTSANLTFSAASDIVVQAATAAALEISDGTTKMVAFDSRIAFTMQEVLFTPVASHTLPDAATSRYRHVSLADFTVTLLGQTQVTTVNQGMSLHLGAPTVAQSGGAVTVDQASTLHVPVVTAGGSVTITANRMISTGVADCYLTVGGVWTDTASTMKIKRDIEDMDYAKMPSLMAQVRPVQYQYDKRKWANVDDLGRDRYGVVAEELPDFLRVPGDANHSGISAAVLATFDLAAVKYLYDEKLALEKRIAVLEGRLN